MAAPHQPPWHTLTPEQQQAWHQQARKQAKQDMRGLFRAFLTLYVWVPLGFVALAILLTILFILR